MEKLVFVIALVVLGLLGKPVGPGAVDEVLVSEVEDNGATLARVSVHALRIS